MNHPYLPLTDGHREQMLQEIGVESFTDLIAAIPASLRLKRPLNLPDGLSELELKRRFQKLAKQNQLPELSFLGAGAYQHYIPSIIEHLAGRAELYTAYTPYQPEISQGMLQAIFEYQTFIAELFGLPVANASLYDGPTALAEAVLMAVKETKSRRVLVPSSISPHLLQVLRTYTENSPVELVTLTQAGGLIDQNHLERELSVGTGVVIIQNPNFFGLIEDFPELIKLIKAHHSTVICYVHPLTLGVLEAPGNLGADIVVGEGQPLGIPVAYGGPYLGLLAVSETYLRRIPGRLVGETVDNSGRRAFVLTLQTREQHIRREKATSNICSNQALCALRAAIYLATVGPLGLKEISSRCFNNAHYLYDQLIASGYSPLYQAPFFMEFAIKTPKPAEYYIEKLIPKGILPGYPLVKTHPDLPDSLLICATEIFAKSELDRFVSEMRCLL